MKIIAIICNVVLLGFTCLVLVSEGISGETGDLILTALLLLVPILSSVVIYRSGLRNGWKLGRKATMEKKRGGKSSNAMILAIVTLLCNLVLLGFISWAAVKAYPHPEEQGFLAYEILAFLAPMLSLVVIVFDGMSGGSGLQGKKSIKRIARINAPAKERE